MLTDWPSRFCAKPPLEVVALKMCFVVESARKKTKDPQETTWNRRMDPWERRNADGKGRNMEEM